MTGWILLILAIPGLAIAALVVATTARRRADEALAAAKALRRRLEAFENRRWVQGAPAEASAEALEAATEPEIEPALVATPVPETPREVPVAAAIAATEPEPELLEPPTPSSAIDAERARIRRELETLPAARETSLEARIGGRWFNWIGILALILGVAYLVKYAHTQGWISPWAQVLGGVALGLVVVGAGAVAERRHYPVLARGFWGGGIAILYLAFFAGRRIHGILSPGKSFAGMVGVTIVSASLAIGYRSQVVAVFAAIGGYLTPVLLGSERPDQAFLFTYLAILTAGLLAVGFARRWTFLHPIAFAASLAYFVGWWLGQESDWQTTVAFVVVFFVLFTAEPVLSAAFLRTRAGGWALVSAAVATALAVPATVDLVAEHARAWTGLAVAFFGAYHLGASALCARSGAGSGLTRWFAHAGVLLVVLVPALEPTLDGWREGAAWTALGLVLVVAGGRFGRPAVVWGSATTLLGVGRLLFDVPWNLGRAVDSWVPLWSERGFAFLTCALAVGAAASVVGRRRPRTDRDAYAVSLLWIAFLALPITFLTLELRDFLLTRTDLVPGDRAISLWTSLLWGAYASGILVVGARRGLMWLRVVGVVSWTFVWAKVVFHDLPGGLPAARPFLQVRFAVLAALALLGFGAHRTIARRAGAPLAARLLRLLFLGASNGLLLVGISLEWVDAVRPMDHRPGWERATLVALPAFAAVHGALLMALGRIRGTPYLPWIGARLVGAAPVAAILVVAARYVPAAVPFLNVRTITWAVVAVAVFVASRWVESFPWAKAVRAGAILEGHALVVALLTLEVNDIFRTANVGNLLPDWLEPGHARQLAFSMTWALYALGLVIAGFRTRYRPLRLFGLAFLAGTVLKVFLVDLSFLETPYRILSFIGLGLVLVGVSYLYGRFRERLVG